MDCTVAEHQLLQRHRRLHNVLRNETEDTSSSLDTEERPVNTQQSYFKKKNLSLSSRIGTIYNLSCG